MSQVYESNDLPLLVQIINQRMARGETVRVDADISGMMARGVITRIWASHPDVISKNGLPVQPIRLHWTSAAQYGDGSGYIRADLFDSRFDLIKDEDGSWLLVNAGDNNEAA